jgi:hypothetical protein
MDEVQKKTLLHFVTHHRQNPLDFTNIEFHRHPFCDFGDERSVWTNERTGGKHDFMCHALRVTNTSEM